MALLYILWTSLCLILDSSLFVRAGCSGDAQVCPLLCDCRPKDSGVALNCAHKGVSSIPHVLPRQAVRIDISHNNLTSIKAQDFSSCDRLAYLDLSHNVIHSIARNAFQSLGRSLRSLHLHNNQIEFQSGSVPNGTLSTLSSLEELTIQNNNWKLMSTFRYDIIKDKPHLKVLALDSPPGNTSLGDEFSELSSLEKLHLSGGIPHLSNGTLSPLHKLPITEFAITHSLLNFVDVNALSHLPNITLLDLSYNSDLGLGENLYQAWYGLRTSNLTTLRLKAVVKQFDYITYKIEAAFLRYLNETPVTDLYLDVNGLVEIKAKFHEVLPQLQKLSLSYNRFFDYVAYVMLDAYHLKSLLYLDLSNQSKFPTASNALSNTSSVGTRHDHNIPAFISPNLQYLNLSAAFPAAYKIINNLIFYSINSHIAVVDASLNKIEEMKGEVIMQPPHDIHFDLFNLSNCGLKHISPSMFSHHMSISVADLSGNNLGQEITQDTSGICLKQLEQSKCRELRLASNNVRSVPVNFFIHTNVLERIDLSDNSLSVWQSSLKHMQNLTFLDLSSNLIPYLEVQAYQEFEGMAEQRSFMIDLSDNPLECECHSLGFLKWMSSTKATILNKDEYTCHKSGQILGLRNLTTIIGEMEIQCSSKLWIIVAGVSCVMIFIIISLSVAVYRHRWDIRYCFLRLRRQRQQYEILTDDRSFKFDAFVAYHQSDLTWITHQLLPNLESGQDPLNFCIHHRNWLPGPTIEENICFSVENCRKTLALISNKFLKSGWCEFEMEIARMRGFEEGKQIIVVVALEEIPIDKMNRTLINLRRTHTWLDWFEYDNDRQRFWSLLRESLRV